MRYRDFLPVASRPESGCNLLDDVGAVLGRVPGIDEFHLTGRI